MTGDVEETCSLLQISPVEVPVPSNINVPVAQPTSVPLINSNMTVDDHCLYTAAISSDLASNFPEGAVLQIMPDSTIVALAVKDLPASNGSPVIFKDPAFSIENDQNTLNLPNLLTETNSHIDQADVDVPACSEENMSDIDLSFLNEAEENAAITDPKCLSEGAVKELQGIIVNVSSQSLNLLHSNFNLSNSNFKSSQEQTHIDSETSKESNDSPGDVVMIDVTKPIQLSQNSLIMVNGQKCILQQDAQTGQVVAYPVKEQNKPRRRRGRPRKSTGEQSVKDTEENENRSIRETESVSDEEREKGLLDIVNDDGELVRRSSRKRKMTKVLQDYETGNLKQELGSDIEDTEPDKDVESCMRRKKARGPGRPRKYIKPIDTDLDSNADNGIRRQRGRPKKIALENEPTQAFLVHTADGQVLMMQVPLSSIPPGVSLQEMAQEIANKLNLGFNQANNILSLDEKDTISKDLQAEPIMATIGNTSELTETISEPALQDHSVGSTTNFPNIEVQQLNSSDGNSDNVDSTCQDMISNINEIIGDQVCETEVILESEGCVKDSILPESTSENGNKLNSLEVIEDNFCVNMPSTPSMHNASILCSLDDPLTDHDFFLPKSVVPKPMKDAKPIKGKENPKLLKDIFEKSDILKDKVDFQLVLHSENEINSETQNINVDELLNKNSNSVNSDKLILSVNKLKHSSATHNTNLVKNKKCFLEEGYTPKMPNVDCSNEISKNILKSVDSETKTNGICLQNESLIEDSHCDDIIGNEYLNTTGSTEAEPPNKSASQFIKSDKPNSENQMVEIILPLQEVPSSLESSIAKDINSSATTVIPVTKKVLPTLLPSQSFSEPKKCKICQITYLSVEEMIEHFKVKHPKCICTECNYMNEHPYVIKRHAFRHTNHGCVCKICNKKYKDLYILKMHIKMVHLPPDVLYACEICEKKFTRKAHLKRHLRIHAPIKQYQCPHCDYKGCEKSDITKHLLIHEEPKFKCEICGKAFRHAKNKELHLKRHSGQRDYKCAACGFFGYTYTDIRKHIERRHAVACSQCREIFTDVESLKEHKKIGSCQPNILEENKVIKIEESPNIILDNKETASLDELPLDFFETDQSQIMTISECSEETLSALQNGQLIMTSAGEILNTQSGQLIVEGLEDNIITPDIPSVISMEKDSNKMITVVMSNGRNISLPLKNCSLPLECVTAISESNISEPFILASETEAVS